MRHTIFFAMCAFALVACDIDQTEEGELPDIDISAEAGEMPAYDVDWADVDVGMTTRMAEVPHVEVTMREEQVEVPYIDISMPNGQDLGEQTERTIIVEAEVSEGMHEIDIQGVYAVGNRLVVVSELDPTGEPLQQARVRISDRLVLNAPEDLDVRHYIIGERPDGDFNQQYNYISDRSEIAELLSEGRELYSDRA